MNGKKAHTIHLDEAYLCRIDAYAQLAPTPEKALALHAFQRECLLRRDFLDFAGLEHRVAKTLPREPFLELLVFGNVRWELP